MRDPSAVKEDIRQRVDLVDLISEHTALKRQGRNFVGLCPFHQEKTPSFSVNPEKQFFKCFGCNAGGDIFTFLQLRESVDFPEALRMLADRAGVELRPAGQGGPTTVGRSDIARVNAWACDYYSKRLAHPDIGRSAREYLDDRGVSPEMVERFGIGLAVGEGNQLIRDAGAAGIDHKTLLEAGLCKINERESLYDTFRDRLMFPIRDSMKRCIGFGGRTLVNAPAKYMNTPETALFIKSKSLYGIDLARDAIAKMGEAIVVEGYTDCIAAHQYGFENTVATLGTAATEAHMALLRRQCETVVLVFDSDAAGEAAADRALAVALKHNLSVRLTSVPSGKDPSEFLQHSGTQAFRSLLNSAVDALLFKWNRARARYRGAESAAGRREAADEFVTLVSELSEFGVLDAIQQGIIVGQLASLLSVPAERVQRLLVKRSSTGGRSVPEIRPTQGRTWQPLDPEQAALVAILEVVVNEPDLLEQVTDVFDPQRFADPMHRRLAERVRQWALSAKPRALADLLSCTEDTLEAELLTDLVTRGSRTGNYQATLEGAARRLACISSARTTNRLGDELKSVDSTDREKLSELYRRLKGGHGFAGRPAVESIEGLRAAGR